MTEKTLEIVLKARDEASKPIEGIKDRIQRARDSINQSGGKGGIDAMAKSVGDLAKLARVVALVEHGANAASGVFQAGSAAVKAPNMKQPS